MTDRVVYEPHYSTSWALVIGINDYLHGGPLAYACNDAEGVHASLIGRLSFPKDNVLTLLNDAATKASILSAFLEFSTNKIQPNDRVLVFYAGHGTTRVGARGEIGFLVPHDGDPADLNSLVRWDDLTRNAELIAAKHLLFIMDACYGGLAVQRYLKPGSARFAKDMLQRYSRQVITAGKADETVADAGGPRAGHSVFTGHLLDGLDGAAATSDGLLTANGVMAYVYDRVAKDYHSNQTPHFGFLDGDGDMILDLQPLEKLEGDEHQEHDLLVEVPAALSAPIQEGTRQGFSDRVKEYLSDRKHRIELHEAFSAELRKVLARVDEDSFPVQAVSYSDEEFQSRLRQYEDIVGDLASGLILLCRWGEAEHRTTIQQTLSRIPDAHSESGGLTIFLGLRWYPAMLLLYASGIAALSAREYDNLATALLAPVGKRHTAEDSEPIIVPTVEGILEVQRGDAFKRLPGHERNHVPRSEYLFKVVQPYLEDLLFLGRDYERLFDQFEVLYALVYADLCLDERGDVWGPPGRFGWKYSGRRRPRNPFDDLVADAQIQKEKWGSIRAGLFGGSFERFETVANGYRALLGELKWF